MKIVAGMVGLWVAAAALAARLPLPDAGPDGSGERDSSTVAKLFGSSREVISQQLYAEADRYFHKGVSGQSERAFSDHLFLKWADVISPRDHSELEGGSIAEIMPWLRMATQADSSNIEAYSTAAYWLFAQGETEAARAVLEEAQKSNPGDYRATQALGMHDFRTGDHQHALEQFELARGQWPSGQSVEDKQTQLDLSAILSFRASLYERGGQIDHAMRGYRELVAIFPNREAIRDRLHQLEHGHEVATTSDDFWADQLAGIEQARGGSHLTAGAEIGHVHHEGCAHGHDDHAGHDH